MDCYSVLVGIPTALLLIAAGRILAYAVRRISGPRARIILAVGLFLAAAAPLIEATRESYNLSTARHLDPAMAQQLPLVVPVLNSLCGELPASFRHEFRPRAKPSSGKPARQAPPWSRPATPASTKTQATTTSS